MDLSQDFIIAEYIFLAKITFRNLAFIYQLGFALHKKCKLSPKCGLKEHLEFPIIIVGCVQLAPKKAQEKRK